MTINQATILDQAFRTARTFNRFTSHPVTDDDIRALYDLVKWGPTAVNSQPARFVFIKSPEAKARLKPALMGGNVDKVMSAPVTVIVATDSAYFDAIPKVFPAAPQMRDHFANNPEYAQQEGFRNSSLAAAYLILAARLSGWDCGPMTGFDAHLVDQTFFKDTPWRANMLVNIGKGDPAANYPRAPRLDFSEAAKIL